MPKLSQEERFHKLQARLPALWQGLQDDPHQERTVVVVPSMSLDTEGLQRLGGSIHYEERLLSFLTLLSLPRTRVVFVSSRPIPDEIISYYLQFLPGVPFSHARQRLHLLSVADSSERPLTEKILERPAMLERIRRTVVSRKSSYLEVYRSTDLERRLAVALDLPVLGPDPRHAPLGTKSGSRKMFARVGIDHPAGFEDLRDEDDLARAIVALHRSHPAYKRVIVKLDDGFAGMGNAIFSMNLLREAPGLAEAEAVRRVRAVLPRRLRVHGGGADGESYLATFRRMRGIVEGFVEGSRRESPTIQLYMNPLGRGTIESTHDQIMGGPDLMSYLGGRFPANPVYREALHAAGRALVAPMAEEGVVGPLSVDFVAVPSRGRDWKLQAVEINLRRGGTTHPLHTLKFLTGGCYSEQDGQFHLATGETRYYVASDSIAPGAARGFAPQDLIDVSTYAGLHYNSSAHRGVVFHIIGALSQFGRVGATCIGTSAPDAQALYEQTCRTLEEESRTTRWLG